jgi:hypothetical protein
VTADAEGEGDGAGFRQAAVDDREAIGVNQIGVLAKLAE